MLDIHCKSEKANPPLQISVFTAATRSGGQCCSAAQHSCERCSRFMRRLASADDAAATSTAQSQVRTKDKMWRCTSMLMRGCITELAQKVNFV